MSTRFGTSGYVRLSDIRFILHGDFGSDPCSDRPCVGDGEHLYLCRGLRSYHNRGVQLQTVDSVTVGSGH